MIVESVFSNFSIYIPHQYLANRGEHKPVNVTFIHNSFYSMLMQRCQSLSVLLFIDWLLVLCVSRYQRPLYMKHSTIFTILKQSPPPDKKQNMVVKLKNNKSCSTQNQNHIDYWPNMIGLSFVLFLL